MADRARARRCSRPELAPLEPRELLSADLNVQPTPDEQYMLELINRARADPPGAAQRLLAVARNDPLIQDMTRDWDLNEFVQRLNATPPLPPLAFNTRLIAAARNHDSVMLAKNAQQHSPTGYLTNPAVAAASDGQAFFPIGQGYWATGENVFAYTGNVNKPTTKEYVDYLHQGLMIDWSNPDYGHLSNIMASAPSRADGSERTYSQIGIGLLTNAYPHTSPPANPDNPANRGLDVGPVIVTQEFGWRETDDAMLVGVAYQDADGSLFYTPGEGLAHTSIQAVGQHGEGTYGTTSWDSGGYALALPPGDYTVTATGPNLPYAQTAVIHIGTDNVSWNLAYGAVAQADRPVPADYDGDGKTDIAVYRPSTGQWIIERSSGGVQVNSFGGGMADTPIPADYDGDGMADLAIFRSNPGIWFIQLSGGGKVVSYFGGNYTDTPVSADYDGDGKSDIAFYRGYTGQWFILESSTGRKIIAAFGTPHVDLPAPGDFDGDRKTDLAVLNPPTGIWTIFGTSSGPYQLSLGAPGADQPVVADFDGDGRSDAALYRTDTGEWFIRQSSAGYRHEYFGGLGGYQPLVAHLDGGAKSNPTLFRPSSGQWFLMNAARINSIRSFGRAGSASWLYSSPSPPPPPASAGYAAVASAETSSGASASTPTPPAAPPTPAPAPTPPAPLTPQARRLLRIAQAKQRAAQRQLHLYRKQVRQ
jgi:hypothetical protein